MIFALANEQGKNPVSVSLSGNIPEAGSREAEAILGRAPAHPDMTEKRGRRGSVGGMKRILSRDKPKREVDHHENV